MVHCIQLDTKMKWHNNILFFVWIIRYSQVVNHNKCWWVFCVHLEQFACSHTISHPNAAWSALSAVAGLHQKRCHDMQLHPKVDSPSNNFCISPLTTAMRTLMPGQWLAGLTWEARLSAPSSRLPMCHLFNTIKKVFLPICHLTKPPSTDRHAEPEPLLARADMSPSSSNNLWANWLKSNSPRIIVCPTWPRLQQGRQILQQSLLSLQL